MNATQLERFAHRAAANIVDPLCRAAFAEKHREAAALIAGTLAGLNAGCPDGHDVAAAVDAQLGTALLSLRMVADRIEAGTVYTPTAIEHPGSDLVDETGPLYAFTAEQLADRDAAQRDLGRREALTVFTAERNVLVMQ